MPLGDCVLWTGSLDVQGYGRRKVGGGYKRAHRLVWEAANGPIPSGLELHHTCQNPACVNLAHLELVTRSEHRRRHMRTHCRNGHLLDDANTYIHKGVRYCRACNAAAQRRRKARRES